MEVLRNGLTQSELERLALLAEEMGECIQIAGKILRFGYGETAPQTNLPNRVLLEIEMGHVLHWAEEMMRHGDINRAVVEEAKKAKAEDYRNDDEEKTNETP
jgi:hypothetical protein